MIVVFEHKSNLKILWNQYKKKRVNGTKSDIKDVK